MIALRILAFVVGTLIVVTTCLSAVQTVVVPRATSLRITRTVFVALRRGFEAVANERRDFATRDRVMALYAPLALVMLLFVWLLLVMAGFTLMHWAVDGGSWHFAFVNSGSSMLTLGVRFDPAIPSATLSFVQAALGLGLVALLISYLPTIYGSFSRREASVGLLEARAGTPPSPYELLVRYQRIGALDGIDDELFARWEQWFIEVEESHTTFPALVFFRSPQPSRNWVTAAGCVLDTAALRLSIVDLGGGNPGRTALTLRTGFLALRRIASYYGIPHDPDPAPTDPITVTRREFDLMCYELIAAGVPLRSDRERAWRDYQGWRVNYDATLVGLAKMVLAPEGRWSSDRPGQIAKPKLFIRRPR